MKNLKLVVVLIFFTSCSKKPEVIPVTNENVKDVLTTYFSKNPERNVTIETDYGVMKITLYDDTPLHTANFIKHIKEGTYENAEFYRIFYQFMIQGGIFPKELAYTIPAEFNPKYIHKKGALSMARSDENNPNLESSATEFFVVQGSPYADYQVANEEENNKLKLTPEQRQIYMSQGGYMSLDQQYTVFGEVTEGLDVIDKIASVKVYSQDKPLKTIRIRITLE
ncbi:MAG TPA: peptidylprolyl isomerase [Chryseosolibacter sp.]|nr:peptidylprolyl isomerase [Chryseosolibacter sp.]